MAGTNIYLSNDTADVSGYLKAYVGYPSPNSTAATPSTAVTECAAAGTDIAMTLTSGGAAAKWITQVFKNDVVVAGAVFVNLWAKESAATTNAQVGITLAEYTTSAQSAFLSASIGGVEALTTISQNAWTIPPAAIASTFGYVSTTIDAGNRLIIAPHVYNIGTMAAGRVTMDYNVYTPGTDGDTFITVTEQVRLSAGQTGSGTTPAIADGPSAMAYGDYPRQLNPVLQALGPNVDPPIGQWTNIQDELNIQGNVGNTDTVQSA